MSSTGATLSSQAVELVMRKRRFPPAVVKALEQGMFVRIRAGTDPHRFIGIWAVVVDGRVFVRSWSLKPRSWWRTFLEEPAGAIQVAGEEIPVRAVQTTSDRLRDAIDRAYLAKYHTEGWIKYARDLGSAKSRDTTTELVPVQTGHDAADASAAASSRSGRPRKQRAATRTRS